MKSGTTTLHALLDSHPQIFIPAHEIHYFCIDDFLAHAPILSRSSKQWMWNRYRDEPTSEERKWYASFFEDAKPGQLVGEDSTQYLFSALAPERIRKILPDVKMIFLLRNPVDRAWSQYLHIMRSGRAMWDFEKMLEIQPATLLFQGLYKEHLTRWYSYFNPNNIKIILFEDLVGNAEHVLVEICKFIGLDADIGKFDLTSKHFNKARCPKRESVQLWRNRLLQGVDRRIASEHFPRKLDPRDWGDGFRTRLIERLNILINPHSPNAKPKMSHETRQLLNAFYSVRNEGLSELIGDSRVSTWHDVNRHDVRTRALTFT